MSELVEDGDEVVAIRVIDIDEGGASESYRLRSISVFYSLSDLVHLHQISLPYLLCLSHDHLSVLHSSSFAILRRPFPLAVALYSTLSPYCHNSS